MDVLGPLRVHAGDATDDRVDRAGQGPRQLLGILALARGAPVGKERLADLLWGEHRPLHVAAALTSYASVLRHGVGLDGAIESRSTTYRLDTGEVRLDLDDFDREVTAAAGQPPGVARAHLQHALGLVRDELLADEPGAAWVDPERSRYRRRHVEVLVAAAEAALACRDLEAGVALAERALQVESLDEPAARVLLLGLHALGLREAALRRHEQFAARLRAELSIEPAAPLRELADAVRQDEPPVTLLPPIAPDVRVWPWDAGPPSAPLLGRTAELEALAGQAALLREGRTGLVLVHGEAGVGKTRLACEFVHRIDLPVGVTRCLQPERRLPYAALLRALRGAVTPDRFDPVSEVVGEVLRETRTGHEREILPVLARVVDDVGPVVLVLDDAHHADRSSLVALDHLSHAAPALAVATARRRSMAPRHPLPLLDAVLDVHLLPLTPSELEEGGLSELHATTGGLPLLVAEWLRARQAGDLAALPARLAPWADEQVRRAGSPARDLLAAAAAVHTRFSLDDLGPVVGPVSPAVIDAVEHLCEAGLLREDAGGYAISCDLVREICVSAALPVRVRLVGELLRAQGGTTDTASRATSADVPRCCWPLPHRSARRP